MSNTYKYRVIDVKSGIILAQAMTLASLYPESEQPWAALEERTPDGAWIRVPSLRRSPDGQWL